MRIKLLALLILGAMTLSARHKNKQDEQALQNILTRLNSLEEQNRQLLDEVRNLRQQVSSSNGISLNTAAVPPDSEPKLEERVQVNEQRLSEQAQSKVEASQKFPLRLNGMLLFNAFENSPDHSNSSIGPFYSLGPGRSGATLRQTLVGLQFDGPPLPGNGRVNGNLLMDFWSGPPSPGDNWIRLRQATLSLDWANRSFAVGQDKPLISPYQPDSLAEVGIPPLAGAGNLWLWLPQVRYQEHIRLGQNSGVTAAAALLQTDETYAQFPASQINTPDPARPAFEGRASVWHKWDDIRRLEIGSGVHASTSHVAGQSIASRAYTADWLFSANRKLRFNGLFYQGQNLSGLGALNNALSFDADHQAHAVQSIGSWTQLSVLATNRLTWNLFAGTEQDRHAATNAASYARYLVYASNLLYHLGPNVVVGLEAAQSRGKTAAGQAQLQNHYDLAIGYLF